MIVDSHQHIWDLRFPDYGWLEAPRHSVALRRSYTVTDLLRMMKDAGVDAGYLVHAGEAEAESIRLIGAAAGAAPIRGVVVTADLRSASAADAIDRLASHRSVRGFRIDAGVGLPRAEALDALVDRDLCLDVVVPVGSDLEAVRRLCDRAPGLRVVLDHMGRPDLRSGVRAWRSSVARLAELPSLFVKISGLGNLDGFETFEQVRPYVTHLIDLIGPSRLMWGSDWPVNVESGGTAAALYHVRAFIEDLSPDDQDRILATTALRCYR